MAGADLPSCLGQAAVAVLTAPQPTDKVALTRRHAAAWREGRLAPPSAVTPPDRPARPGHPELRPPRDMPSRRKPGSRGGRIALLHALAHIELNAIDLAWDIIARFGAGAGQPGAVLPRGFLDDWVAVAADEALHFQLLAERLAALDAGYGDLPAHDGLWQAARNTAHDLLARLAVVPLVLEARGLDVTPGMIATLDRIGDPDGAAVLRRIHDDEITHVAAGHRWFLHLCAATGRAPVTTWQDLVTRHFRGGLKPPFNIDSRGRAGLSPDYYAPLARQDAGP